MRRDPPRSKAPVVYGDIIVEVNLWFRSSRLTMRVHPVSNTCLPMTTATTTIPIQVFDECTSTMDVARDIFEGTPGLPSKTLIPPPFAIRALSQTKGRGTGAREWASLSGNLHLTVVIPAFSNPRVQALLPSIIGIVLFNSLNRVVLSKVNAQRSSEENAAAAPVMLLQNETSPLVLKWPNDVLVRATGAKVCGNIVESLYNKDKKQTALSIGIGVNVATPVIISDGGRAGATLLDVIEQLTGSKPQPEAKGDAVVSSSISKSGSSIKLDAQEVAEDVCRELLFALQQAAASPEVVVPEFAKRLDMRTPVFRRLDDGRQRDPTPLQPLRLTEFGALVAKSTATGEEVELSADYLF
jgi:biotin-(acetyl-CoA carboxylase) ligase